MNVTSSPLKFKGSVYQLQYRQPIPERPTDEQINHLYSQIQTADRNSPGYDGDVVQFFTYDNRPFAATGSQAEALMYGFNDQKDTIYYDQYINQVGGSLTQNASTLVIDWNA